MMGIYAYVDTKDNSVVYVGKDSHIDKGIRRKAHMWPSRYEGQKFNRILQRNPNRYEYKEVFVFDEISQTELNQLEMQQIALFNPKFNFTKGGEGIKGFKHSEETKHKISIMKSGENNHNFGKRYSEEERKKFSKIKMGEKNPMYGKHHSKESCMRLSLERNTSGYYRVYKQKHRTSKQGFIFCYRYYNGGKRHAIVSVDLKKLEEKVKAKGLEWYKLEELE